MAEAGDEELRARLHGLRRALHAATLQLAVARLSAGEGAEGALAKVGAALGRAADEVDALEQEVLR